MMNTKNSQARFNESTKTQNPVPVDRAATLWHAVLGAKAEGLASLRADLNRALDEYRLGHYDEAESSLLKILNCLTAYMNNPEMIEGDGQVRILLLTASTQSVLGRVYEQMNRDEEAANLFRQALSTFDDLFSRGEEGLATPQDYREYGVGLLKFERVDEAVRALKKSIEVGYSHPEIFRYLGTGLKKQGNYEEAIKYLGVALDFLPDDLLSLVALAETLEETGRTAEAANTYLRAALSLQYTNQLDKVLTFVDHSLALVPDNLQPLKVKGEALRLLNRNEEALEVINRALELDPNDAFALGTKGQILRALERQEEAVAVLSRCVELDPNLGWAYAELGEALRLLGRNEEALEAIDRALVLEPDDPQVLSEKSTALQTLGRYEESLEVLDKLLKLNPDDETAEIALTNKGEALRLLNRNEEALEVINRALELDPNDAFALGTKGQILRALERQEEAVAVLSRCVELDPNLGWAYAELGEALRLLGRNEEALEAIDRALVLEPDDPQILGSRGAIEHARGHYQEALEALNRSLKVFPDNSWALTVKGSVLCDIAEFEKALDTVNQVTESAPQNTRSAALILKGWALENLDNAREAKQAYEEVLSLSPGNPWAHKGVANALYMLEELEDAKKKYLSILEEFKERNQVDAYTLSLKGWCHFRVEQYDEAMRRYVDSLSLNSNLVSVQFDLALASMASDRYNLALREYERGIGLAKQEHKLRCRCLLYVALDDLNLILKTRPDLKEVKEYKSASDMLALVYDNVKDTSIEVD